MTKSYVDASDNLELRDIAKDLLASRERHRPLRECGVTIGFCRVFNSNGNAIETRGIRAIGQARIVGPKERAHGMPDAVIYLDGEWWDNATDVQKRSLIDHELTHFEVSLVLDDDGAETREPDGRLACKRDAMGRPKLKYKHHDAEIGIFHDLISDYQEKGVDFLAVARVVSEVRPLVQGTFWG